ncbi:MAG: hypothetical protein II049_07015 [Clostridia bacterium]|nr:hypothetical protein [Clostridia bacterium]
MLTYEEALFYKVMLGAGMDVHFASFLDRLLAEEDPLSDVTLALSAARRDVNAVIHVLKEYLLTAKEGQINTKAAFDRVVGYLKERYEADPDRLKDLSQTMHVIAFSSEQPYEEPWYQLYMASEEYDMVEIKVLQESEYREYLEAFLYEKKPFFSK